MKRFYPHNHCVFADTLQAIRSRHPVVTDARQYAPGRYEIGYGNRNSVDKDTRVTLCQAEDLLRNDIQYVEAFIRLCVANRITDGCYQALVSFFYDVGPKSEAARMRIAMVHDRREDGFFDGLEGLKDASRFGPDIGLAARFWECKQRDL